jgi:hypothetical protein
MNVSLLSSTDGYSIDLDALQGHPFVQCVAQVVFFAYFAVDLFGVPANIFILFRLRKLAKDDNERYTNGSGLGLFAMAIADLFSLVTISIHNILYSVEISAKQ